MANNPYIPDNNIKLLPAPKLPDPPDITWKEPKPIELALLPVMKFNPEWLPPSIRDRVVDIAKRKDNAPIDFAAIGTICALATVIGRRFALAPKEHDDWPVVCNVWALAIGRPSIKKTPTIREALSPLYDLEKKAKAEFLKEMDSFQCKKVTSDLFIKAATIEAEKLVKQGKAAEADLHIQDAYAKAPTEPERKRFLTNDATIEVLSKLMAANPMGLLQFRDELTGLLVIFKKPDKAEYRAFYLEAWNGTGSYISDRISRGTIDTDSLTLTLLGCIQPAKLKPFLEAQRWGTEDDGFIERFQLAVYPDPEPARVDQKPDQKAKEKVDALFDRLAALPESDPNAIPLLRFSPEAQECFNAWYDELTTRINSVEKGTPMESHLSKYTSLLASLALIFHLVEKVNPQSAVNIDSLQMAIKWCEYLETHARRIYGLVGEGFQGAKSLAKRLKDLPDPFQTKDFSNKGWSGLGTAEERNTSLEVLCERGYLYKEIQPTASKSKTVYYINPHIYLL